MAKNKLKPAYISKLCSELYDGISSGISISDSIYMLINDSEDDPVLEQLYNKTCKGGGTFCDAVKSTKAFPSYAEEMIEIGEKSGRLDSVLKSLSEYYARQEEISENIKSAVTFPVILLVILIVIITVLLTQIMPIFNNVFNQLGVTMSSAAVSLMNIGTAVRNYAVVIIAVLAVAAAAAFALYKLPATHDKLVSLFKGKKLRNNMSSSKFASAMSMTMSSGLDIDDSLEMSKKLCDAETCKKITACQEIMKKGVGFDKAVQESKILDSASSRRLTISFHAGKTDETMKKIADSYAVKVNDTVDRKISRVEPVMVIIMSLLVGFVLFSVMLPMLSVITTI